MCNLEHTDIWQQFLDSKIWNSTWLTNAIMKTDFWQISSGFRGGPSRLRPPPAPLWATNRRRHWQWSFFLHEKAPNFVDQDQWQLFNFRVWFRFGCLGGVKGREGDGGEREGEGRGSGRPLMQIPGSAPADCPICTKFCTDMCNHILRWLQQKVANFWKSCNHYISVKNKILMEFRTQTFAMASMQTVWTKKRHFWIKDGRWTPYLILKIKMPYSRPLEKICCQ